LTRGQLPQRAGLPVLNGGGRRGCHHGTPGSVGIDLKELWGSAAEIFEILPKD